MRSLALDARHRVLLVACDGLFDVYKYDEAVTFIAERRLAGDAPAAVADALVDDALKRGSLDNVTAIVVYLDQH